MHDVSSSSSDDDAMTPLRRKPRSFRNRLAKMSLDAASPFVVHGDFIDI